MVKRALVPESLQAVLHYVNAQPTEKTWRRLALGRAADLILAPDSEPPNLATMGLRSLDGLNHILAEYRDVLSRWVHLESAYSIDARALLQMLNQRAQARFAGWGLSPVSEQLVEKWETDELTFSQALFAQLALALKEVPFRTIHRCEACQRFFYDPSQRRVMYCSAACRNRTMVRRYRARKAGQQKVRGKRAHATRKTQSGTRRTARRGVRE